MNRESTVCKILDLPGGTLMPFPSVPGERVRILYGRVWLTEKGSPRDAFLASGEEVALGTRGLAVIEALSPARVQLFESVSMWDRGYKGFRRVTRLLSAWWLRQFRRPIAARAAWF